MHDYWYQVKQVLLMIYHVSHISLQPGLASQKTEQKTSLLK